MIKGLFAYILFADGSFFLTAARAFDEALDYQHVYNGTHTDCLGIKGANNR